MRVIYTIYGKTAKQKRDLIIEEYSAINKMFCRDIETYSTE